MSAQDAQATLARTLLEAARVEAVVTARVKAETESEIEALRAQLDAVKRAAAAGQVPPDEARGCVAGGSAALALRSPGPIDPFVLDGRDRPSDPEKGVEENLPAEYAGASRSAVRTAARVALLAAVLAVSIVAYSVTVPHMIDRAVGPAAAIVAELASAMGIVVPWPQDARSEGTAATPSAVEANWLLYMPVEPASVAAYLGAPAYRSDQLAVKKATTVNQ